MVLSLNCTRESPAELLKILKPRLCSRTSRGGTQAMIALKALQVIPMCSRGQEPLPSNLSLGKTQLQLVLWVKIHSHVQMGCVLSLDTLARSTSLGYLNLQGDKLPASGNFAFYILETGVGGEHVLSRKNTAHFF